ncbi:hypothetical protein ABZ816_33700 [Actinosynnema sp. NPDC047251]|uniref:hypothetical protein n=1 Tax=Saccharothrix espanaensis TaxID=103731 RepID=UPI0011DDDE71|nr:hypothetical protein [Saccharothrix espanaensis]
MIALHESAMTDGHSPDQAWRRLTQDTAVLREHLEWLAEQGRPLPGDPALVAAAMGGMLSSLAYAILRTDTTGLSDDQVLDTLTALLATGLRGTWPGSTSGLGIAAARRSAKWAPAVSTAAAKRMFPGASRGRGAVWWGRTAWGADDVPAGLSTRVPHLPT